MPDIPEHEDDDAAQIRERYQAAARQALSSIPTRDRGGCLFWGLMLLLLFSGVLIPLVIVLVFKRLFGKPDLEPITRARAFIDNSVPVMAYPLMVNSMLRQPGERPAPALVLISFDPAVSMKRMIELSIDVSAEAGDWSEADQKFAHELMADEEHQPFRRRRLPESIAGGATIYACDLMVLPALLPNQHVSEDFPFIPCMAEPGDQGAIIPMPTSLIAGPTLNPKEQEALPLSLLLVHSLEQKANR